MDLDEIEEQMGFAYSIKEIKSVLKVAIPDLDLKNKKLKN